MADRDPIAEVLGGREDLYDVAEWDARTALDSVAVALHAALHGLKRYGLLTLALVLFVAQLAFAGVLIRDEPSLGVLALLSAVPAFLLVAWVWWDDPTRREPLDNLAITFVLSVLFASIAALVNSLFGALFELIPLVGTALFFFLVVGPIEETVKWLAIRSYAYNSDRFDAVIDGAVYGAMAGLGFATIENALYIVQGYLSAASVPNLTQIQGAAGAAVGRSLVGPGHVLYSAFAGYYLGLAKFNRENKGPIVVKGLLVAAFIHGAYNTLVTYAPAFIPWNVVTFLGVILGFDLIVAYALYRKLSRYSRYYHRASEAAGAANPEQVGDAASGPVDEP